VTWRQTNGDGHPTILKLARRGVGGWVTEEVTRVDTPLNYISRTSVVVRNGAPAIGFTPQPSTIWKLMFAHRPAIGE
jgi:hypothetical protein